MKNLPLWSDFRGWKQTGRQPTAYNFAVWINRYFAGMQDLPQDLREYEWQRSFDLPVVIYYDERVTVEVVECLHRFLRTQSCDITNIILLTSHCLGLSHWWKRRCELYQEQSFTVVEWLFVRTHSWRYHFANLDMIHKDLVLAEKHRMRYLFNFYGGTNPRLDRLYLTLKIRDLDPIGLTDLLCDFVVEPQKIVAHAMYLGYFCDSKEEMHMQDLYQRYIRDNRMILNPEVEQMRQGVLAVDPRGIKNADPCFNSQGYQFWFDSHFLCTVANETDNTQPWTMISEKTLRSFWHHNVVIPNAYRSVELLESKGFWFPKDIIDFGYQYEPDWLKRINLMIQTIQQTNLNMHGRFYEYFADNFDRFAHNARLIQQHHQTDIN